MSLPPDLAARLAEVQRRADLAAVIGRAVKLGEAGREFEGLCPFHSESTPSFTVAPEKGFWHCFGCNAHGDVLGFVQQHQGLDFIGALAVLEAECGISGDIAGGGAAPAPARSSAPPQRESVKAQRGDACVTSTEAGVAVWRQGGAAAGSLAETYLRVRGIDPAASALLRTVRYHPRCPVARWKRWEGPGDARLTAPAMLTPICVLAAPGEGAARWTMQGVHITFLTPDGRAKASLPPWRDRDGTWRARPSRKIWGEAALGCVPMAPADWQDHWQHAGWLKRPGELVVGEGLESTHSLLERVPGARGAVATLSLNVLQGSLDESDWPRVAGGGRALPLWNVRGDPARPGFTLPDAGAVAIGIDADMKGFPERWVQERPRAAPVRRAVTGAERSAICAALASDHWRRAGACPVRVLRPPMGMDFNDMAMAAGA